MSVREGPPDLSDKLKRYIKALECRLNIMRSLLTCIEGINTFTKGNPYQQGVKEEEGCDLDCGNCSYFDTWEGACVKEKAGPVRKVHHWSIYKKNRCSGVCPCRNKSYYFKEEEASS